MRRQCSGLPQKKVKFAVLDYLKTCLFSGVIVLKLLEKYFLQDRLNFYDKSN